MGETMQERVADRIWGFILNAVNDEYGYQDFLHIITEESTPVIDALTIQLGCLREEYNKLIDERDELILQVEAMRPVVEHLAKYPLRRDDEKPHPVYAPRVEDRILLNRLVSDVPEERGFWDLTVGLVYQARAVVKKIKEIEGREK